MAITQLSKRLSHSSTGQDGNWLPRQNNAHPRIEHFNLLWEDIYNILAQINAGWLYQGTIDCSGNPNYPAAAAKDFYWKVSVAGKIGGGAGTDVEVGDDIIAIVANAGGTEAAVGSSFMIVQRNMKPCTVATLQTGTDNADFVTAKTLTDALNGGTAAFATTTIMTLSGGSTRQLSLLCGATQDALFIDAGTVNHTGAGPLVSVDLDIAGGPCSVIKGDIDVTTTALSADTIRGCYWDINGLALDTDGSALIGYDVILTAPTTSRADTIGYKVIIDSVRDNADYDTGLGCEFSGTMNHASADTYGVRVVATGLIHTQGTFHGLYVNASTASANNANAFQYGAHIIMPATYQTTAGNTAALYATGNGNSAWLLLGDGFKLVMTEPAGVGFNYLGDVTDADNRIQTFVASRDLKGALTVDRTIQNYSFDFSQEVDNATAGNIDVTNSAGMMRLVTSHTVSPTGGTKAQHDTFSGTTLYIHNHGTTIAAADALLTATSRCLDIDYQLTIGAASTIDLATTDVARISLNIPIGITSTGAYDLTMLNLDGSGYLGNDANTSLTGVGIDFSGTKTVSLLRCVDITMESAAGNLSQGIFINAGSSVNNYAIHAYCLNGANTDSSSYGINVDKYVLLSGTPAANKTNAGYGVVIDTRSRNTCTDGSDAITTAGAINILTGITNTAATAPTADTNSGKGIVLEVTASVADDANSVISAFSAGAIGIDYNLTKAAAGAITVDDWGGAGYQGIIAIDYDATATAGGGSLTFGDGNYNFFNVIASDNGTVPVYGTCTMAAYGADLTGLDVSDASLTLYGLKIAMPTTYGASTEAGIYVTGNTNILEVLGTNGLTLTMGTAASLGVNILSDVVDGNNSKQSIYASRDITGALSADVASSLTIAEFRMDNVNTSATDFDLTTGGNVMIVALSHTSTTAGAKTDTDPVTGRGLVVDIDLVTSGANDKVTVGAAHTAFIVDYTETQTGGLISHQGFEVASIQYNTTGNIDYTAGNYDLLYILGTNNAGVPTYAATTYISGLKMDLSGMTVSDADLTLYGLNIVMPATYGVATESAIHATGNGNIFDALLGDGLRLTMAEAASIGINVLSDTTVANAMQSITTSRDINGTVVGAVALTGYANVFGQAVNHTGGDFIVTQTAGTAGIMNLVLAHTTNIGAATTAPDVFSSTALNIDIDATVAGDASADLDVAARAFDVSYTLTETLGVMRLAATDIARIVVTVPAGITSAGAYNFNILNLDGSGYVGNDANTTLRGINIDLGHSAAAAELTGVYIDAGGAGTTKRALYATDGTRVISLANGSAHISSTAALITDMPVTAPGIGFDTAGGVLYVPHGKKGVAGMYYEEIYIDLQAAAVSAVATDGDAIGEAAGGAAYIGQITAALNGTVVAIEIICMEVPGGGSADINIYSNASNAIAYDGALGGGTLLVDAAGNWTLGMMKVANNLPAADEYLYLGNGTAAGAGAYNAGKFIVRIYGV